MASPEPFLTEEQRRLMRSMSFGNNPTAKEGAAASKNVTQDQRLMRSTSFSNNTCTREGSAAAAADAHTKQSKNSAKHDRRSQSGKLSRTKKEGAGGRGTWGSWLETNGVACVDRNDPNYDSEEEPYKLVTMPAVQSVKDYKNKVTDIVEEYFTTDDIEEAAEQIQELGCSMYHHYFVKKLITMSLDRHDREKEMAALLLSSLYADLLQPDQLIKGYSKLVESAEDLAIDIPDAVEALAVFVARAIVDEILPPVFLRNTMLNLPESSNGHEVLRVAEKSYLSPPMHADIVERKWGGSTHTTVEAVRRKIDALLNEYIESGDRAEACRCIRELNVPFFHHEVVKRSLMLAMEVKNSEEKIFCLLKNAAEEGLVTSSQMSKGFTRVVAAIDDLSLDIPHAKDMFQGLITKAIQSGLLSASSATTLAFTKQNTSSEEDQLVQFKQKATSIIQEYFFSDDVTEVVQSLQDMAVPQLYHNFVKRLITSAMERKKREKEMASVLLSSLYAEALSVEDVVKAFVSLLASADDTVLDIPDAANELALFLARAVIDDVLVPLDLDEIKKQMKPVSLGSEIVHAARAVLAAPHASERVLRCWGGGSGWAVDDAKDKIIKLLEEYEAGGDVSEACHCIRDLDMPFFHHEVVKRALVMAMEKQNDALLKLLGVCSNEGLITLNQMSKGFIRVADSLDDLALDIPNAKEKFACYLQKAKSDGWLVTNFTAGVESVPKTNGFANGKPET